MYSYPLDVYNQFSFGVPVNVLRQDERMLRSSLVLVTVLLFSGTLVSSMKAEVASAGNGFAAVKTRFEPNAILSRNELLSVLALARDCGVSEVEEVYTYNIHPSSAYGIRVKSRETVRGREISFVNVLMDYEKFSSKKTREMAHVFKANGGFWVSQGCVSPVVQTTFIVHGNTIRVELLDSIPLRMADRIVAGFASGKIRYATEKLKKEVGQERVDLSKPLEVWLDKDGKTFGASFPLGDFAGMNLKFIFEGEAVTVINVSVWVS